MTCLPESGKCERPFTDAFVEYLNDSENRHYVHRVCLDVLHRDTAQPEALYEDVEHDLEMVIERKSISWPTDYMYRHQNDHMVGDTFSQALGNLLSDDLYELRLPPLITGKRSDLRSFALAAAASVRKRWPLAPGNAFRQRVNKHLWWYFRRVPADEREENRPSTGLKLVWEGPDLFSQEYLDPANAPDDLVAKLQNMYSSCAAKFGDYAKARRVLILDPHGELRYKDLDWWSSLWQSQPPPPEIGEVWSGTFDWIDDYSQDWLFERLK